MNSFDAFEPPLELDLVFANLGFHRRHDCLEPGFGVAVGAFESAPDLQCDLLEEALRDLVLFVRHQLEHGVDVRIAPAFKAVDILLVTDQRKTVRRAEFEAVFDRKLFVDGFHHRQDLADFTVRILEPGVRDAEKILHRVG